MTLTVADLDNAKLDVEHIAEIANSPEPTSTDRMGQIKETIAGLSAHFPNAYDDAVAAAASAATAQGAANAAVAAQGASELARDQALATGKVYADDTAGLAATATGGYFSTPSPNDAESLILKLDNGSTAVEQKRMPSAVAVDNERILAGTLRDALPADLVGATTANTTATGNANFWTPMLLVAKQDQWLHQVAVRTNAAGSLQVLVVTVGGVVISDTTLALPVAGVNTVAGFAPIFVPSGARVFVRTLTTILMTLAGAAGDCNSLNIASSQYTGIVGDTLPDPSVNITTLAVQLSFKYASDPVGLQADNALALVAGVQAAMTRRRTSQQTGTWAVGAPPIQRFQVQFDAATDVPVGAAFSAIVLDLIAQTGTDHFRFTIAERSTQTDAQVDLTTDTVRQVLVRTPAELGLTLDAAASQEVNIPINTITVVAGKVYVILVEARTVKLAGINFGLGNTSTSDTRQRRRGWYSSGISGGFGSAVSAGSASSIGFIYYGAANAAAAVFDYVSAASATVAGMNVTVTATFSRNGVDSTISTTQAITPATAANVRYDVLYYDQNAGTFGVQAGTERATDPSEFIPALADSKRLALFNTRATSTAVTVVPVWNTFNGEDKALEVEQERERRRGRLCLQRTIGKVRRGAAVKIVSFGDSIVALQTGTTPPTTTPDGANRDRDFYYLDKIGSDLVNTYPKYTAVQLGRADDGAGAVHLKLSLVWELANAMAAAGSVVTYNNFGVGGTSTANAVDGSLNPTAWTNAVIALAPDLVVFNFGMNEQGDTATEARTVAALTALRNAGIEVIVMGVARRHPSTLSLANWEYTNRALRRAAIFTRCAYQSTLALYDARYIGAIGVSTADTSSSNGNNHPGIREHMAMGAELVKTVMGAA